ncbi:methyltransferase type 12 [Streptomonospora alba]|uniref:Methyltransferase type 12 n=1 Tax=Streptomonospora alba TaxID=183763 RepID=A0A0C2JHF6_9ACTN|nr:class I SAM-dependent methyltransferase [Streptomonospora alba]KIH96427.1 methyltransferase type 12 [Streptomonospora alba]
MVSPRIPPVYRALDFNSPLSDERADRLIRTLAPLAGSRVVDLGCGWAELLLRAVAAEPAATGLGIDSDEDAVAHGRANAAARGLAERVEPATGDAGRWSGGPEDAVINVGAAHVWGGAPETHTSNALAALSDLLRPGGRLLFGECFWLRTPTSAELSAMPIPRLQYRSLPDLVEVALSHGFRLLALSQADLDEWDDFESRHAQGREDWLRQNPDSPEAGEVRAKADAHRDARLRGMRETVGFAYLTLVRV